MVGGRASSRRRSPGGGALGLRGRPASSLSSDAFDFNYGVCVMRMREGLNVSEVMQAHSECAPHLLGTPSKTGAGSQKVLEPIFLKCYREEKGK